MPVELKTCLQRWQCYGTKLFSLRWVLLVLVLAALYFGSKYNYYGGSRPDLTDVTSLLTKHRVVAPRIQSQNGIWCKEDSLGELTSCGILQAQAYPLHFTFVIKVDNTYYLSSHNWYLIDLFDMPVELKTCLQRWQWYGTKLFSLRWVLLVLVLAALYFGSKYNYYGGSRPDLTDVTSVRLKHVRIHKLSNSHGHHRIHVVVVVCNNRTQQALTMIKSMITFSSQIIDLHLFVEDALKDTLSDQLHQWNKLTPNRVVLNFYSIRFPGGHEDEWIKLFKPCACQRLFMPELLSQLDAAIYVDTDTLFMHNVSDLWSEFAHFSADHIAGLSSESEDGGSSWYNRFARHPYVKPYGVNSGVFLMNLTRMRQFGWMRHLWPTFKAHASVLTWGDQDIINIIFAKHGPGKLYMLGCEWNFRPDHCMYDLTCTDAQFDGAKLIHGSRGSFYNRKQLPFTLLSDVFNKYEYGTDVRNNLYEPFYNKLISADRMDSCSKYPAAFYGQLTIYLAIS